MFKKRKIKIYYGSVEITLEEDLYFGINHPILMMILL